MKHFMIPTITRKKGASLCRSGSTVWTDRLAISFKSFAAFLVLAMALPALSTVQAQCFDTGDCPAAGDFTGANATGTDPGVCFAILQLTDDLPGVIADPNCSPSAAITDGEGEIITLTPNVNCVDVTGFTGDFAPGTWSESGTGNGGSLSFAGNIATLTANDAPGFGLSTYTMTSAGVPADGFVSFEIAEPGLTPSDFTGLSANVEVLVNGLVVAEETNLNSAPVGTFPNGFPGREFSVPVQAGQTVSIRVTSGFAQSITLEVSAFTFTCTVRPEVYALIYTGTAEITYSAGSSVCEFEVEVVDDEAPVVTCSSGVNGNGVVPVSLDEDGVVGVPVNNFVDAVTDNCSGVVNLEVSRDGGTTWLDDVVFFSCADLTPGGDPNAGPVDLLVRATDANNNVSATCAVTARVRDDIQPTLAYCPNDRIYTVADGTCEQTVTDLLVPAVNDGCLGEQLMDFIGLYEGATDPFNGTALPGIMTDTDVTDGFVGGDFPAGVYTILFRYTDPSGPVQGQNPIECSYVIEVLDDEAPDVTCTANDLNNPNDPGQCGAVVNFTEPTATDLCGPATRVSRTHKPGDFFPVGLTTVTYVFSDAAGNLASCEFVVGVVDNEAPVIDNCAAIQASDPIILGSVCDDLLVPDYRGLFVISDNCAVTDVQQVPAPGTPVNTLPDVDLPLLQNEVFGVKVYINDAANNGGDGVVECAFEVVLQDNEAPYLTDSDQLWIRDCNKDGKINMDDNLEFGCVEEGTTFCYDVPYMLDCNGCWVPGTITGVLPPEFSFIPGVGDPCDRDPDGIPDSGDEYQLPQLCIDLNQLPASWTFTWEFFDQNNAQDPPPPGGSGNVVTIGPLTYEFMEDSKAPVVNCPPNRTLYTAYNGGFGYTANDDCTVTDVDNIKVEFFDVEAEGCRLAQCQAMIPVYPPDLGLCPDFFSDPAGDVFGGYFTDNCGPDGLVVEFRRQLYPGCNIPGYNPNDFDPTAGWIDDDNDPATDWNDAASVDISTLTYDLGLTEIQYRVTDSKDNVSDVCTFYIKVEDNEQPMWGTEDDMAANEKTLQNGLEAIGGTRDVDFKFAFQNPAPQGNKSQQARFALDCNSPFFQDHLQFLQDFSPVAYDECAGDLNVDNGGVYQDGNTSDQDVACGTNFVNMPLDYVKRTIFKLFIAEDDCGNLLNDGDGDGNAAAPVGGPDDDDDDRFRFGIVITDYDAPRWDPGFETDGTGITTGEVKLPVGADEDALNCNSTGAGAFDAPRTFACTLPQIIYNLDADLGVTDACEASLADRLQVEAIDCSTITYSWEIVSAVDCYGNTIVALDGLTGNGNDAGQGLIFPVGQYTIEYTATDECLLSSTLTFGLKINDDVPPVWESDLCDSEIIAKANAGVCATVVTWEPPFATDNCDGVAHTEVEAFDELGNPIEIISAGEPGCVEQETFIEQWAPSAWVEFVGNGNGDLDWNGDKNTNATEMYITNDVAGGNGNSEQTDAIIIAPSTGAISFTFEGITPIESDLALLIDGIEVWNSGLEEDGSTNYLVSHNQEIRLRFTSRDLPLLDGEDQVTIENWEFTCDAAAYGWFPVGENTVRYIAEDYCGMPQNKDTCEFKVIVEDKQNPWASCIDNLTLDLNEDCTATVTAAMVDNNSDDNCKVANVQLVRATTDTAEQFVIMGVGTETFQLLVTDKSGNQSTCEVEVETVDNIVPAITCVPYVEFSAGADCKYTANATDALPIVSDNCDAAPAVANSINDAATLDGIIFSQGTTDVTWTVTDASGNSATCITTVNVVDNTAPTITTPVVADLTITPNPNGCDATVEFPYSATDNCDDPVAVLTSTPDSGDLFPVGTTTVTVYAEDAAGNGASETFEVTVTDEVDPVVLCNDITITLDAAGDGSITVDQIASATDNCGVISDISADITTFDCDDIAASPIAVTVTAVDAAGNDATCTANVTVTDFGDDYQIVYCPADIVVDAPADACEAVVTLLVPQVQQGCGGPIDMTTTTASPSTFPVGSTTVTYTFTSPLSQTTLTCAYNVIVNDVTAPAIQYSLVLLISLLPSQWVSVKWQ
jgi:hypothetical protein